MPIIGCKKYVEGFEPVYLQANMAYSGHLEPLSKYAIKYHRRSHEALHQLWQNETIESLMPLQFHDYMKGTDLVTNLSKDNLESDKIVAEFQDIYARIMVLHKAFENITNESNAVDNFDDSYFRDFITMSGYLKSEIIRALEVLNIAKPDYNSPNLKDGHTKELRDWIVIREHMKLLKYIQEVNRILEMNCSNGD